MTTTLPTPARPGRPPRRRAAYLLAVLTTSLALSGCTSHATRTSGPATPSASASAPTSQAPAPAPPTQPATSPATPTATPRTSTRCATGQLRLTVHQAGAAAGTAYWAVVLQNAGTAPCTLTGYPGVSFTDAAGHQLGLPATRAPGQPTATVTLAPGGDAHALVGVPNPANFQAGTCHPAQTSLVRVYPPDQRAALTAPLRTSTCTTGDGRTQVTTVAAGEGSGPAG